MFRGILAVVTGLVAAFIVVAIGEGISVLTFSGVVSPDEEVMRAAIAKLPLGAFLTVLAAHFAGSFLGGYTAAYFSREGQMACALVVGGLLLAAGIWNLLHIPHPAWFATIDLLQYVPLAYAGGRLGEHFT